MTIMTIPWRTRSITAEKTKKNWRLLKDKITQKYYSWDTSDAPGRRLLPENRGLGFPVEPSRPSSSERAQKAIASKSPTLRQKIESLHADTSASTAKNFVRRYQSSSGAIARAQYDLDAGDWQVVFPVGLLSDAPKENYQIQLSALTPGEHTIAITITDRFAEHGDLKVTFTVPPRTLPHK